MSLRSWKKSFYRKEAINTTLQEALKHSITKWRGLLTANRKKHGLMGTAHLQDKSGAMFSVLSSTCALCVHYAMDGCVACPLYKIRGNYRCDRAATYVDTSPYTMYTNYGDAEPMLHWLELAKGVPNA